MIGMDKIMPPNEPLKENQKVKLKKTCPICGKGVTGGGPGSLTNWLFSERRCTCGTGGASGVRSLPAVIAASTDGGINKADMVVTSEQAVSKLNDRYLILSVLGQGGIGIVYKVEDTRSHRIFAAKVLSPQHAQDRAMVKRFEQEAQAASGLNQANLVSIYDQGRADSGMPFFIMDFVPGKDLAKILYDEVRLPAARVIGIFIQVLQAVQYAHEYGIIHRDIKPSNIIITNDDFVKVVDFGIAKIMPKNVDATSKLTQVGEIFGSPSYMSPEQCTGGKIDARSDIYSIGCVMYETLTGMVPFQGDNPVQTILKHVNEDPKAIAKLPGDFKIPNPLDSAIMHCLEKNPINRYQSAQAMEKDLEAIRDGRQIRIPKPVKGKVQPLRVKLIKLAAGIAGGGIVGIVIFSIFTFLSPPDLSHPASILNPFNDAQKLDDLSFRYFTSGQYERAIPLLEFGIKTYKERGRGDTYLADNLQHIGKCYLMLGKYEQAVPYYEKALAIYRRYGNYPGSQRPEAISDYDTVLKKLKELNERNNSGENKHQ